MEIDRFGRITMLDNKYGKIIAKFRRKIDLTQYELGEKLGVSANCISAWEVGRNEPNMEQVKKMADIFGCTVSELMGIEDYPSNMSVLSDDEEFIIESYRKMDAEQQKKMLVYVIGIINGRK